MRTLNSINAYEEVKNCRTCLSSNLEIVLDLGLHPLANSLLDYEDQSETLIPLILVRCTDCTTVQLSVNVKPELMFQNYLWVTGTTQTALNHCDSLAKLIIEKSEIASPRALEIGSNDGTLLEALVRNGAKEVIGVDPASNLQPIHLSGAIKLVEGFFDSSLSKRISKDFEKVDLVVARNVLSHVPSLNDVMHGIDEIVHENGMIVIEFHEASKILTELHYESIYHEHTFYHSIRSVQAALSQIGFRIFDISESPISGGSHVIYASKREKSPSLNLLAAMKEEESKGVYLADAWREFARLSLENLTNLRNLFEANSSSKWIAFGASARSSTLLNSVGINAKILGSIADHNPLKQGKYSPGLHMPIVSPRKAITTEIEKVFICAFNFEDEIVEFLTNEMQWHGEVVLPLPLTVRSYKV